MGDEPKRAHLAPQLSTAVGSIGANFAEGYSRGSPKDRCRLYEYGLGSARESRHWCYKGRSTIGIERTKASMALLTKIIQMLTVIVRNERTRSLNARER